MSLRWLPTDHKMAHGDGQPAILAIGTAVPQYGGEQSDIGEWMAASFTGRPALARMIRTLCAYSGVETRYSCTPDYLLPPTESRFAPGAPPERSPSTRERMAIYEEAAPPLGAEAAQRALALYAEKHGIAPEAAAATITHLVVVSCTGFFAPGLDFVLANRLGLPATVERTLIGFMGCAAMFNGLRTAYQITRSDPSAVALVVSVELCTLHTQPNPLRDHLIGASLFADGASACVVGMPQACAGDYLRLERFYTCMKPGTAQEMAWQIGDYGFDLRLSPRVPDHLADVAPAALAALFGDESPQFWAIHPGGPAIINRLAETYALNGAQVAASRTVLRRYGNLSSATILFVLAELAGRLGGAQESSPIDANSNGHSSAPLSGVAMAFGPGLVLEFARLTYVPAGPAHVPVAGTWGHYSAALTQSG